MMVDVQQIAKEYKYRRAVPTRFVADNAEIYYLDPFPEGQESHKTMMIGIPRMLIVQGDKYQVVSFLDLGRCGIKNLHVLDEE